MINGKCQHLNHNDKTRPIATHILTFRRDCGCNDEAVTKPSAMCYDHTIAWKMRPTAGRPSQCRVCGKVGWVRLKSADKL